MRIRVCIIVVLLAAGACGSDAGDADRDGETTTTPESTDADTVEVVASSLRATGDSDPNGLQFTSAEAECAAEMIADEISRARLEELGLSVDAATAPELSEPPLTTAEGDVVYRAYDACLDLVAQLEASLQHLASGDMPEDVARCMADAYLESGILREALLNPQQNEELTDRISAFLTSAEETCSA